MGDNGHIGVSLTVNFYYDVFVPLCARFNKSPSKVAIEIGCSKSMVSNWKTRGTFPTDTTLMKIATYFGVSVEDLLADNKTPATTNGDGLTDMEREILTLYRSDPEARARMEFEVQQFKKRTARK